MPRWREGRGARGSSSGPRGRGAVPGGLPYRLVGGERRVARHEEVQPGRGDQRGNQPDEVVVHVPGIPERGGAGGHDGGDLRGGRGQRARHGLTAQRVQIPLRAAAPGKHPRGRPGEGRGPSFTAPGCPPRRPAHRMGSDWIRTAGKAHAGCPRGKSPAHQLVDLRERRVLNVQPVCRDPIQGCVVQNHLQEKSSVESLGSSWRKGSAGHMSKGTGSPRTALRGRWQTLETTS